MKEKSTHKYIKLLIQSVEVFRFYYILNYFPIVKFLQRFSKNDLLAKRIEYNKWVNGQTEKRCSMETARPDFMTLILKHNEEAKGAHLTQDQINSNAMLFLTGE